MIARLEAHYGRPDPPRVTDPFEMAVWEAVAYLVPDQRRREVYDRLLAQVGTDPAALAAMPRARLAELIADGGMQPDRRAEKLQLAADLALEGHTDVVEVSGLGLDRFDERGRSAYVDPIALPFPVTADDDDLEDG